MNSALFILIPVVLVVVLVAMVCLNSFHVIGPAEVGLVTKRFGKKGSNGQLVSLHGEAGFQAALLMPGMRFKLWPLFSVKSYPWVQVPAGGIGVVLSQVGEPLLQGAKSAVYKDSFGQFSDLEAFLNNGGQLGVQRKVLPPGTTAPIHPVAFVVMTESEIFGEVLSNATKATIHSVQAEELRVFKITPLRDDQQRKVDVVGVVTTLEGPPSGDIASRIGGFEDILTLEQEGSATPITVIQAVLQSKNGTHDNYQNFQDFLDGGGHLGLQHDPLLYGSYVLNPFLVKVELVPMLVVEQGEVAVIKSYVGLPTEDTSGDEFKFGSIVKPGHQGIWSEPLRTGKYPLNPRIYEAEKVPTSILTLNWSRATSEAHDLDRRLSPIDAKSKEAFDFAIDLQVQIHVPDTNAPRVISMVATMQNLVDEVLQSAVGNYFRNKLQTLGATEFIQKRDEVQEQAEEYIEGYLGRYDVETRGVYIQDVVFPEDLVKVLTQREIASQEKETFVNQQAAQEARVALEQQRGVADAQAGLASARVSVDVEKANAEAAVARADGQAKVVKLGGEADADRITKVGAANASAEEAIGVARAKGFQAQQDAIGRDQTAAVAMLDSIGNGHTQIVPQILVGGNGGVLDGLGALLMSSLSHNGNGLGPAPADTTDGREPTATLVGAAEVHHEGDPAGDHNSDS